MIRPGVVHLEINWHKVQPFGDSIAEFDQPLSLPLLGTWSVDLKCLKTASNLRPALSKDVQARAEDDMLSDAVVSLFRYEVLDKPSAYHDTCTVTGDRAHEKQERQSRHPCPHGALLLRTADLRNRLACR